MDRAAIAEEGGSGIYSPGQLASFASVPGDAGFSLETTYYHRQVTAAASFDFPLDGRVDAGIATTEDLVFLTPGYAFAHPVLGGQLWVGVGFAFGGSITSVSATLTAPDGTTLSGSESDAMKNFGDMFPSAVLKWASGPNNFMTYLGVNVPVGEYDPHRIAGLGSGRWAIDGGLGYTFLSATGLEASLTVGATKNFVNPYTQYQSGTVGHVDWGVSYSPTDDFYFGAAGYFYRQLEADTGPEAEALGGFQSRVNGIGPQLGYAFSTPSFEVEVDLRGYKEFGAVNRPEGWTLWFTVSLSEFRRKHAKR